MASGNSWADQWDSTNNEEYNSNSASDVRREKGNGKMAKVKVVALSGLEKAKIVASVGVQKVKSGTSTGIKWIKNQYQKRTSK
uniref:Uncharacterized protein n=1 Tax=Picea sitchensis TaxID=3332 RepID=B8LNY7_PICSI|nr:unknown [Picea sitchensis]